MSTAATGGSEFRGITPGVEFMRESFTLPRHRHRTPYASVVLSGMLDEAGFNGRIQARAGDVLLHPAFDSHCNSRVLTGLRLIRLNWSDTCFLSGLFQIADPDSIAILAERDPEQASLLLSESLGRHPVPSSHANNDWPDLLAAQLRRNQVQSIGGWARRHQLAPETVSRGFALAYGVTPQVFRAEARALLAWQRISTDAGSLAAVAAETGFADQAHMTRWVHRISGAAPRAWRRPPPAAGPTCQPPSCCISAGYTPRADAAESRRRKTCRHNAEPYNAPAECSVDATHGCSL